MSDTYEARVLADSISPDGVRIVTILATFPRFLLAEWNTHRVFGRNSASSRAIPPEKIIERVLTNPFVPDFNRRVRGMGVGEALNEDDAKRAREAWIVASYKAMDAARVLIDLDVDKSRINRLLEPWMWHTCITTSTEWGNFFGLRQPSGDGPVPDQTFPAQPEFQIIARMVRDAMDASDPQELQAGQWHLPLVSVDELSDLCVNPEKAMEWALVSSSRCARVSYGTQEQDESHEASLARAKTLISSGHWSALEHAARPIQLSDLDDPVADKIFAPMHIDKDRPVSTEFFCGHLRGWVCLRKLYENEHDRSLMIADRPEVEAL